MISKLWTALAVLVLALSACASGVAASELAPVLERDGVAFDAADIPDEVLLYLADYPVVVIGETHLIREQREFTAAVVEGLWDHGYRQLLLEWPHLADWVVSEFVGDGDFASEWSPPTWLYGDLLRELRAFNRDLPEDERIAVRGIDVNLDNYGGAQAFRESLEALGQRLPTTGPIGSFLERSYDTADEQIGALEPLQAALASDRDGLIATWGRRWYDVVQEMVEIEIGSVPVRATWDTDPDGSAELREHLMMQLADARLAGYPHGSVVNVGGNHAQKDYLKGTDQEWLGDYLVHTSPAPSGPVVSVVVVPAQVVADFPTELPDWALSDASPENELFWLMSEAWPAQTVFLPFTDRLFRQGHVAMNFEDRIYVDSPERYYDAAILLPLTHRIPLP